MQVFCKQLFVLLLLMLFSVVFIFIGIVVDGCGDANDSGDGGKSAVDVVIFRIFRSQRSLCGNFSCFFIYSLQFYTNVYGDIWSKIISESVAVSFLFPIHIRNLFHSFSLFATMQRCVEMRCPTPEEEITQQMRFFSYSFHDHIRFCSVQCINENT